MRIVSLLPSTTEILFAIGAGDDVVGVTFECDFPEEAKSRPIVSNSALTEGLSPGDIDAEVRARVAAGEELYKLDEGALRTLDPDVVVTQDLCAVCAIDVSDVDAALQHLGCRAEVVTIDPSRLDDVLESILVLGKVTGREERAGTLVDGLRARLEAVAAAVAGRARPRVAMLEWSEPLFSSGHWVPDLVLAAGAEPVLGAPGEYSHHVAPADVRDARPDIVVVAPCGYRLEGACEQADALMAAGVLPEGIPVWAMDADALVVRPGPRLVDGVEALAAIAHPGLVQMPRGAAALVPFPR